MAWFWEQSQYVIDGSKIPDVTKFMYLCNLLEVKAAIQGLSLSAAYCKDAVNILKEHFGRTEKNCVLAHSGTVECLISSVKWSI